MNKGYGVTAVRQEPYSNDPTVTSKLNLDPDSHVLLVQEWMCLSSFPGSLEIIES